MRCKQNVKKIWKNFYIYCRYIFVDRILCPLNPFTNVMKPWKPGNFGVFENPKQSRFLWSNEKDSISNRSYGLRNLHESCRGVLPLLSTSRLETKGHKELPFTFFALATRANWLLRNT